MDGTLDPEPATGFGPDGLQAAASSAPDARAAVAELADELKDLDAAFVLVFVADAYDLDAVAEALSASFGRVPVIGCTTAGEISPEGYASNSISAIAFPRRHFRMTSVAIDPLTGYSVSRVIEGCRGLAAEFGATPGWRQMALMFSDGVAKQEDTLVAAIENGLAPVPVLGGSAGDNLAFRETRILHDGYFRSDAAVLALIETDFEFTEVCFDHFISGDQKMVVTAADPAERLVFEINAAPAAEEYARLIGVPVEKLTPFVFAANPVLVRAGGRYHVRAIQQVEPNGALRFQSAIDLGLVLTLGKPLDIVDELDRELGRLCTNRRVPQLVLGFDCILRRLEIEQTGKSAEISAILARNKVIGFNTYGEQHHGMHVNQTFVGVAFYDPNAEVPPQ